MITDDAYEAACRAGDEEQRFAAHSVHYDADRNLIVLLMPGGILISFPPTSVQGLETATPTQLATVHLTGSRIGLRVDSLDWDFSIPRFFEGYLGSPKWMAANMGRLGGMARSVLKSQAARENGKLGGRPRAV